MSSDEDRHVGPQSHPHPHRHAGRRDPPGWRYVFAAFSIAVLLTAGLLIARHHAGAIVHFLVVLAVLAAVAVCQFYAVYRSSKRRDPRPRVHYFLFCLCYLVLAVAGASAGGVADAHHISWLSNLMIWVVGFCMAGLVVTFGRGAFHGRLRRSFWRFPPPWLAGEEAGEQRRAGEKPDESPDGKPSA